MHISRDEFQKKPPIFVSQQGTWFLCYSVWAEAFAIDREWCSMHSLPAHAPQIWYSGARLHLSSRKPTRFPFTHRDFPPHCANINIIFTACSSRQWHITMAPVRHFFALWKGGTGTLFARARIIPTCARARRYPYCAHRIHCHHHHVFIFKPTLSITRRETRREICASF
jgi:hypothetical protein